MLLRCRASHCEFSTSFQFLQFLRRAAREVVSNNMESLGMDDSQRNLIVNYLPSSLTPAAFKTMFSPYGEIESCRIIMDKATGMSPSFVDLHVTYPVVGQSQGYGFVKYTSEDGAQKAIQMLNGIHHP